MIFILHMMTLVGQLSADRLGLEKSKLLREQILENNNQLYINSDNYKCVSHLGFLSRKLPDPTTPSPFSPKTLWNSQSRFDIQKFGGPDQGGLGAILASECPFSE